MKTIKDYHKIIFDTPRAPQQDAPRRSAATNTSRRDYLSGEHPPRPRQFCRNI